jgi:hypothetical protein
VFVDRYWLGFGAHKIKIKKKGERGTHNSYRPSLTRKKLAFNFTASWVSRAISLNLFMPPFPY